MSEKVQGWERLRQASEDARKRSDHTCQSCGKKGENLQAHHWAPKRVRPSDDEVTSDELTALCPLCHAAISRIRDLLVSDKNREEIQKAFENAKDNLEGLRKWIRDANTKENGNAMDNSNKDKLPQSNGDASLSDMLRLLTESNATQIQTNARQTVRIEELERAIEELEAKWKNRVRVFCFLTVIVVLVGIAATYAFPIYFQ